jgi:hypothetical protein
MHRLQQGLIFFSLCLATLAHAQSKGGRWQFENFGLDSAGWDAVDDNGTLQNQAGFGALAPLQEGGAYLWLDSTNVHDFFRVEDSNDLDFTDENVGISAWIYPIVFQRVHFIVTKGDQLPVPKTTNYSLRISETKNLEFLIRDARDRAQRVTSSFTIPLQQWTFVAAYYDFNAKKVYLWNNPTQPVDTLNFDQAIFGNDDPLAIGTWFRSDPASPSTNDFEGRIDDVRISGRMEDLFPTSTAVVRGEDRKFLPLAADLHVLPNPISARGTSGSATVQFVSTLKQVSFIQIYNILGQQVFAAEANEAASPFRFEWNLRDHNGQLLLTGIYFVRIANRDRFLTKRFHVVR